VTSQYLLISDVELFEMSIFVTGNNILPKTPLKGDISFSFNTRIIGAGLQITQATEGEFTMAISFTVIRPAREQGGNYAPSLEIQSGVSLNFAE
jgi:hypothetical protein